jgi:sulfur carrier protein ThiS
VTISVETFGSKEPLQSVDVDGTVLDVLKALGLSAQVYLVARDGDVLPVDEPVADGDRLLLIRIISGG